MGDNTSPVPFFHPESRRIGSSNLIVGRRCTGKTTLLTDLVRRANGEYVEVLAFTPMKRFLPVDQMALGDTKLTVHEMETYHDERLERMATKCYDDAPLSRLFAEAVRAKKKGRQERRLVILDECFFLPHDARSDVLVQVCTSSHHCGIDIYLVVQNLKVLPSVLRNNMDYIYVFGCNVVDDRDIIRREYASCTMKTEFKDKLDGATQGFGVLAIDRIEDQLLEYRVNAQ